ncbi:MAG: GTP-binding protein [Candidatus Lokiarchaeota archaeon]|nr:GTP-binding protein [Candidatus Lokiarchaeota archaeon]
MVLRKNKLFVDFFNKFLELNTEVEAVIVSDSEGLIIAGEKRKDVDIELVSVLTSIVNPVLQRMRNEFSFKRFGNASFDTENHRLLFISVDEERILSLVLNNMASIEKLSPYGLFLAEKTAQILTAEEGDIIQISVPNFEYEAENVQRLKNQLYQMKLGTRGEYRFKFVILGDHEVGKTSINRRFVENKFTDDYRATIGLNVLTHTFEFFGNEIGVTLYDLGAQNYFRRFRKGYYTGAQAAFTVFDLTNRESFNNIKSWYKELKDFTSDEEIPIIIVGNKSDLSTERQVAYKEGVQLANELSEEEKIKLSYIETSALTGENVEDAFNLISYHYVMKSKEIEDERRHNILYEIMASIIRKKIVLTVSFITESTIWSPGLQMVTKIKSLGESSSVRDYEDEQVFQYPNGLILKQHLYSAIDDVSSSDGVFCIFDAIGKDHVDPQWKDMIIRIIKNVKDKGVVLIGIRALERSSWSDIIGELNVDEQLNQKPIELLFFRIGEDFQIDIFDQLRAMFSSIDDKY